MSHPTGAPDPGAAAGHWTLDPARSSVRFHSKTFWGILTVKGEFGSVSGEGDVLPDGTAHGTLTVLAASLDTGNAKRDTHLRSADFFDIEQHTALVFTARTVGAPVDGTVQVAGDLAVRGVTRPLTFPARVTAAGPQDVTLEAEVAIDRGDFGITWNQLGMLKDPSTIAVTAAFRHQG
ncbi:MULTISPECIES: YceI family protein [unclassified Streptomyces]|uniref:YceI family protein n=1 Tax=unclassified Streptomyces TaxID=2593676 RepID=UPI002E27B5CF|nr:YceI family protein [Streptomyces sp. NBC_00223]